MNVVVEILAGNPSRQPRKADMDKNIEALQRAIDGKPFAGDFVLLMDTKSILESIQRQLP